MRQALLVLLQSAANRGIVDALIAEGRRLSDPDNARLAKRLRKQRKNLFTFLEVEGVEVTNNRAERALRPAVVVRKTGERCRSPHAIGLFWGCNRTPQGARTHAVLASLLVTAKQQGRAPMDYLIEVLTARGRLPPLPFERSPPAVQPT